MIIQRNTGSIGAAWPPSYDRRNNRVKGFCPFRIEDNRQYDRLVKDIQEAREAFPQATRSTVRAFMSPQIADRAKGVEARFRAERAFPGFDLVYLGSNADERRSSHEILQAELQSVEGIMATESSPRERILGRVDQAGYSLGRLHGANPRAVLQMLELYSEAYQEYTFELDSGTITEMLSNGNIVLVGRDSQGAIVSSLIAEHAEVQVDGKSVHLYELSDYATFRSHRRNGLITAMQVMAIETIRSLEHGEESIIYAEDRAAWEAVNISSRRAGLEYCGTLEKHCVLVSDRTFAEQGRLENLNVWVAA